MLASSAAFLALGALAVRAQSQATELDLEVEQANFVQSHIVPDLFDSFNPSAVLTVQFNTSDSAAAYGSALTITDVAAQPDITVTPGANFTSEGAFTIAMVDPGVVGADQGEGQTRHWLVNNVYLEGEAPYTLNFSTDAITAYGGPYPADGSGPHRYAIFLMPQPASFSAPSDLSTPGVAISTFDFPSYISTSGLEAPVAGWYMTVEQGTSTVTVESTSAVESSTLPAFGASSSAGASASLSAKASAGASSAKSAGASASAAASSPAPTSGALSKYAPASLLLAGSAFVGFFALF